MVMPNFVSENSSNPQVRQGRALTVNERSPILFSYKYKTYYYERASISKGVEQGNPEVE